MTLTKGGIMAQQLPLDELTGTIARIRGLLLTEEKVERAVHLLAQALKESFPGTLGAGVSLLDRHGRRTSSGFTDSVVERADRMQYDLGQGPCLTAWAAEKTVVIGDLVSDNRWPQWKEAVALLPIRSVVSVPLLSGKDSIGALNLYAALPGEYDDASGRLLTLFAAPAATLLAHIQGSEAPHHMSATLQAALHSRDTVNRACGRLMERHEIGSVQALQELIRQSRTAGMALGEYSADVIAGTPDAEE